MQFKIEEGPGRLLMLRHRWNDGYSHADPDDKGPVNIFLRGRTLSSTLIEETEMSSAVHIAQKPGQDKNMAYTAVEEHLISRQYTWLIETGNTPKVKPKSIILEEDGLQELVPCDEDDSVDEEEPVL